MAENKQVDSRAEALRKWEEYVERYCVTSMNLMTCPCCVFTFVLCRIHYSDRYSDDKFEYRHVILPKPLLKLVPKDYFNPDQSGALRLLSEDEWRAIGIQQSLGWVHYEVHSK